MKTQPVTPQRLIDAHRACVVSRGPRRGKLKTQSPRAGTDASAMWQAMQLAVNPLRVGIGHMMVNAWEDEKFARMCRIYVDRWFEAHGKNQNVGNTQRVSELSNLMGDL